MHVYDCIYRYRVHSFGQNKKKQQLNAKMCFKHEQIMIQKNRTFYISKIEVYIRKKSDFIDFYPHCVRGRTNKHTQYIYTQA